MGQYLFGTNVGSGPGQELRYVLCHKLLDQFWWVDSSPQQCIEDIERAYSVVIVFVEPFPNLLHAFESAGKAAMQGW
jgi:hypothetical protein